MVIQIKQVGPSNLFTLALNAIEGWVFLVGNLVDHQGKYVLCARLFSPYWRSYLPLLLGKNQKRGNHLSGWLRDRIPLPLFASRVQVPLFQP